MKVDALDHPKTLDLAARLDVELPTAIGYLELLFAFVGRKSPQGNVGKWPDGAIARACYWNAAPEVFIKALIDAGFIDKCADHRLLIHDWTDHAPRWVKARLKSLNADFLTVVLSKDASTETTIEATTVASIHGSGSGKDKDSESGVGKNSTTPEADMPPGLNQAAWACWVEYRKQIRKPLKPASMPAAQRKLAAFGSDQAAVVEQSMANGWQGLFALGGQHETCQQIDNSAPGKVRRANAQAINAKRVD